MFGISNWLSIMFIIHIGIYFIICTFVYTKIYLVAVEQMHKIHGLKFAVLKQTMHHGISPSDSGQGGKLKSITMSSLNNSYHGYEAGNQVTSKILIDPGNKDAKNEIKVCSESHDGNHDDKHNHHHGNNHSNKHSNRSEQKSKGRCEDCISTRIARMTSLVLIVLVLCWLPFLLINIICP